jgi:hypothetical protein
MDSDAAKKAESMLNGKLQLLSLFGEMGVLHKEDLPVVIELCAQIIEKSSTHLQAHYHKKENQESEEEDKVRNDPEAIRFLNAIDLGESDDEKAIVKNEEATDQWSTTYFAILCLANLF